MSSEAASRVVNANPTKEFFIHMLTRDIDLVDAIGDLVDNSVDGARRLRGADDQEQVFDSLYVRIKFDAGRFEIVDNCGGIPAVTARDYAFRFGRPPDVKLPAHSIGLFGVGMKRALFKIGRLFTVESIEATSSFTLTVNVDDWSKEQDWSFQFSQADYELDTGPDQERGTTITISQLHLGVSKDFALNSFAAKLRKTLRDHHSPAIQLGMTISVNDQAVISRDITIKQDSNLRPAYEELTLPDPTPDPEQDSPVRVRIYAGVGESSPSDAGWYVFCNGRAVLYADRSPVTGWGQRDGQRIPVYHNQFAQFRGYVFLDSEDASNLPWTTTKTGIDQNAEIYRTVRERMITLMRPVIDYLNELDNEKDREVQPLSEIFERAQDIPIAEVRQVSTFHRTVPAEPTVKLTSITFRKPGGLVDAVKAHLGVSTNRAVGEQTFDYFVEAEEISE